MAKVIEKESVASHGADALLCGELEDFSEAEKAELEARYPGFAASFQEASQTPGWKLGSLLPANFGTEEAPRWVIFAGLGNPPSYFGIRECVQKLAKNAKKMGISRVACGRLGCGAGKIHLGALEPIVAAAAGSLVVDIYLGT